MIPMIGYASGGRLSFGSTAESRQVLGLPAVLRNHYDIECWRLLPDPVTGEPVQTLVWTDTIDNLVVTAGRNLLLDVAFKGAAQDSTWFVGLASSSPTFAAGDVMTSHAGWTDVTDYTGSRPALTLGTVSSGSVDNSASKASFAITGSVTVGGAYVVTDTSGTAGTLYGGGAFTGGDRAVVSGDTLTVTVTLSVTSS